jgi:hypothetical protein
MYRIERLPDARVTFEHKIRKEWVIVNGSAWGDENGIYKRQVNSVMLGDEDVSGLLLPSDFDDLEDAIEAEVLGIASDNRVTGDIPGPYPTL